MPEAVNLQEALVELQKTQELAEDAIKDLTDHNANEDAHPDIRRILQKLVNSDAIWTNQQIQDLVETLLKVHSDTDFKTAHPGWEIFQNDLETRFEEIMTKYNELKDRVDQWYNAQGSTDLQIEIQKVMDKYSPILENLQEAYRQAVDNKQDALAEQYKQNIQSTLEQQNAEIMEVIAKYEETTNPPEPTVQIYITFNSNGGTGEMATQYVNQGDEYYYPACTFTPPEGYEFDKWSSDINGEGQYTGLVGAPLDTSAITSSLTLYAIWKLVPITEDILTKGITIKAPNKAKATIRLVKSMKV